MRNRILNLSLALLMALSLSGCAMLYNDLKIPLPSLGITADTQARTSVGRASCASYVWAVSTGDCSVEAAMKNGGITKVHHVDAEVQSYVFGIYTKFTTVVYGE